MFRRFPPAVFPAILGLLGLVSAWKLGMPLFPVPYALVQVVEGMVTLLFLSFALSYGVKAAIRPKAVIEDLNTLPGRTGLAAMALGFFVLATFFAPRFTSGGLRGSQSWSSLYLCLGAGLLLAIALYVALHRLRGTDQAGPPTPAMHLVFVGFVLVPGSALSLGVPLVLVEALGLYCCAAALVIVALTFRPLVTAEGTPPLRPLHGIHLAPPAFLTVAALQTQHYALATVALTWATGVALLLLFRIRWLTEGGFSGFWSAFTFPVTAFAAALLLYGQMLQVEALRLLGGVVLVAVTLYVPVIAYRVLKLWATGVLAAKTNASIA